VRDIPSADDLSLVLAELRALGCKIDAQRDEIAALRADIELLATRARLSRDELRLLERLLQASGAIVRGKAFAACDVLDVPEMAAMVEGYSASALCWLFARASGRRIGRYRLEAAGRDRTGRLWTVTIS
jgi:hypothetical protein